MTLPLRLPHHAFVRRPPKKIREQFDERDAKDNKRSSPPSGERVEMQSVWLAECYGPSTISGLKDGLDRMGWLRDRPITSPAYEDPNELIGGSRSRLFNSSWADLGMVHGPEWQGFRDSSMTIEDEVPEGVEAIWMSVFTPVAPLTILVAQFVLADSPLQDLIQDELEQERTTKATRTRRGWSFQRPAAQKAESVRTALHGLEDRCGEWLTGRLPGAFGGKLGGGIPSCRLLLLDQHEPFPAARDVAGFGGWLWAANLDSDRDTWTASALPGLKLKMPDSLGDRRSALALTLAGRRGDVLVPESTERPADRGTLAVDARESFDGTMALWAVLNLLRAQQQEMARVRDLESEQSHRARRLRARSTALEAALTIGRDGEIVATEIKEQGLESLFLDSGDFVNSESRQRPGSSAQLLEGWRKALEGEAAAYHGRQRAINKSLTADIQLFQGAASLATQRVLFYLAVVATIAGVAGLLLGLFRSESEDTTIINRTVIERQSGR